MAWNVSESTLKCLHLYAMATGMKKHVIVEDALEEYYKRHEAKQVINAYVNDM